MHPLTSPVSRIGYSTGRGYLNGTELLIAMKCYFDGSEGESDSGTKWLTLAGLTAPDAFWGNFSLKWERMLAERYPVAPYIQMIDLLSRDDPFAWGVAGWSEEKINQLMLDAVDVLQKCDKDNTVNTRSFVRNLACQLIERQSVEADTCLL